MNFFISKDGKPIGPIKLTDLENYQINSDTMVWQEGTDNWKKAKEIEIISTYIRIIPPPIPNSEAAKIAKKYDLSYPKLNKLLNLGVGIIIFSVIVGLIINYFISNGSKYSIELIIFGALLSFLIKIWSVYTAIESARKLNRDEMSWGIGAFFFPGVILIILGTRYKLR
ncbi:MAG TPA: DUF4339 domain-containing protein [Ferruginibacter sp.]|nr:DUF4339 domain-containing protein [Ferruginibacter sp.]